MFLLLVNCKYEFFVQFYVNCLLFVASDIKCCIYFTLLVQVPAFSKDQLDTMLEFVHSLRSSQDPTVSYYSV